MTKPDTSGARCLVGVSVLDAAGVASGEPANGVLLRGERIDRVLHVDESVRSRLDADGVVLDDLGSTLILPAFVNAHAHLDLAHLGTRPFEGDFVSWAGGVASSRAEAEREGVDPTSVVAEAAERSRAEGIAAIGDIAGSEEAVHGFVRSGMPGQTWLEVFGLGAREQRGIETAKARLDALHTGFPSSADTIGLQPHAPYSAGPGLYELAARAGRPSSHLHETLEELRFIDAGDGAWAELLKRIDKWDDSIRGHRRRPLTLLEDALRAAPWVLAHLNYTDDLDLDLLADTDVSVAYCPIASEYFGHSGHRYREMLERGIRVCLGTDSILCQDPHDPQPFGLWSAMRRLFLRDGTDPMTLLRMATTNGAEALGLEPDFATLRPGAPARLQAIPIDSEDPTPPLEQALRSAALTRPVGP